jgi:general secretion pathway protein G
MTKEMTRRAAHCASVGPAGRVARGFTMLEMMLVLVIIGILMGVAVYSFGGYTTSARVQQAKARLRQVGAAVMNYEAANGVNPPDIMTLTLGPTATLMRSAMKDGWKEDLIYYPSSGSGDPNRKFDLYSKGPDKLPSTQDDIDYWVIVESD